MSVPAEKQNVVNAATLRREPAPQSSSQSSSQTSSGSIRDAVRHCLEKYLADLDGHAPADIFQLVLAEVEPAMLETVMHFARDNQTRAADMLGINRTTLRKKLRQYGLD